MREVESERKKPPGLREINERVETGQPLRPDAVKASLPKIMIESPIDKVAGMEPFSIGERRRGKVTTG
ncbi:MAG: hypothetical protein V1921_03970 [Candidatus Altiarchaeota archaeon]